MRITDILTPETIKIPMDAEEKFACIEELVDLLAKAGKITDRDKFLQAVLEREYTRTTGIGHGLAVPHGKCDCMDGLVIAVGVPLTPIDFQSIDKQKVNLIVLLGSPEDQTGPHIQALARISRLMLSSSFRDAIAHAHTPRDIHQAFVDNEM